MSMYCYICGTYHCFHTAQVNAQQQAQMNGLYDAGLAGMFLSSPRAGVGTSASIPVVDENQKTINKKLLLLR